MTGRKMKAAEEPSADDDSCHVCGTWFTWDCGICHKPICSDCSTDGTRFMVACKGECEGAAILMEMDR